MTPQEIISDEEIARVHAHANFGAMSPREVVNEGVRKTAVGYHCGSTQLHILLEHGLATKPRLGSSDISLTKKGKAYGRSIYRVTTPARAEAQAEGAAVLKGVGKINGDGWKDTTTKSEVMFAWNAEKPAPYSPGQYPRVGNEGWTASTSQYSFTPATADDVPAILAALTRARPSPTPATDADTVEALEQIDAAARSGAALSAADYSVSAERLGEPIYRITTPALAALNSAPEGQDAP